MDPNGQIQNVRFYYENRLLWLSLALLVYLEIQWLNAALVSSACRQMPARGSLPLFTACGAVWAPCSWSSRVLMASHLYNGSLCWPGGALLKVIFWHSKWISFLGLSRHWPKQA